MVKNQSAVVVLLRSTVLTKSDKKFLAIFPEGEVIRMRPDYSWEEEFTLNNPFPDAKYVELNITAQALIPDGSKLVEVLERYRFKRNSEKPKRTQLNLQELPMFEIPKIFACLYRTNFKNAGAYGQQEVELLARVNESKELFLRSSETYRRQLTLLNQIEDEHLRQQFFSYSINNPELVDKKFGRMYSLSLGQFKEQPLMLKEETEVLVMVESVTGQKVIRGIIDRMDHKNIVIIMRKKISAEDVVRIQFCANRTALRLEYRALELLDESVIQKLFFPETSEASNYEQFTEFEWFLKRMSSNEEQMKAVKNIVNRTSYPAPYLLFGPPGTGKTATLTEAVCQLHKLRPKSNILIATASNFAANEIVNRLLPLIPTEDIFRFFAKSSERKINEIDVDVRGASNLIRGSYSKPCYEDIYMSRVVVCTMTTAGRLAQANISDKHFDYIFIDECGGAKEVSVLVAIAGIGANEKNINALIVLAGDPHQLGPVITFDFLKNTSQSISMLERMMNHEFYRKDCFGRYNSLIITQLRDNYRSHEALLRFSNSMFYDNQLRAKAPEEVAKWALGWYRLPNRSFPIIFHPVDGQIMKDSSSTSIYNVEEANLIIHYIKDILKEGLKGKRVKQSDIGIISPYARQVNYLRKLCDEHNWSEIEIGSTEQYQGREKLIMLISTVRSRCHSVGFLANVKRLNVALTRARALLIVVGNPVTLERNKQWKGFIAYCRDNGAIFKPASRPKKGKVYVVQPQISVNKNTPQRSNTMKQANSVFWDWDVHQ
ncbi:putative helicase mov-10-B.1 isoform X2 [Toxorhynchites rutilus septentrionalis]|nr:putative helicase mov-10-B.1 isoform X2 [Toxorhynchites rutilus septentrionalis]